MSASVRRDWLAYILQWDRGETLALVPVADEVLNLLTSARTLKLTSTATTLNLLSDADTENLE